MDVTFGIKGIVLVVGLIFLGSLVSADTMGTGVIQGMRGFVFEDVSGIGVLDAGAPPLDMWEVEFIPSTPGAASTFALTGVNGHYGIVLPADTYLVCEVLPPGWIQTYPTHGPQCPNGTIGYNQVRLPGQGIYSVSFGNFKEGTIEGNVFNDMSGEGMHHPATTPMEGWRVHLDRPDGMRDIVKTDAQGHYVFDHLGPGYYTVWEESVEGWSQTYPGLDVNYDVGIASGFQVTDIDFGNHFTYTTRDATFWAEHTAFTAGIFFVKLGNNSTVGNLTHSRLVTNALGDHSSTLFGTYYADVDMQSTGTARDAVDHARMTVLAPLMTAKLNCGAFNCPSQIQILITNADNAYGNGEETNMMNFAAELDAFNVSGSMNTSPFGDPGAPTPDFSEARADIVFWDSP